MKGLGQGIKNTVEKFIKEKEIINLLNPLIAEIQTRTTAPVNTSASSDNPQRDPNNTFSWTISPIRIIEVKFQNNHWELN